METTQKELDLIVAIAESEYTELNGCEPDNADQTAGYVFAVADTNAKGGTLASLLKKGLVWFKKEKNIDDNLVGLTEEGFIAYKSLKTGEG